jgi:predicted GH43/DUF377 family glycosyl hydrolase
VRFIAEKLGLIATVSDFPAEWVSTHLQAPNVLVLHDRVRVYFTTRVQDDQGYVSRPGYLDMSSDLSRVLERSEEPCLDPGEIGGFDMFGIYPASVIQDNGSFLMAYGGWSRPKDVPFEVAIGLAASDCGRQFRRLYPGPILGKTQEEPFILSSPKIRKFNDSYEIFYIAGTSWIRSASRTEPTYKIRGASSVNLADWSRLGRDLITEEIPNESQASPDVFWLGDRYHMFFSYRGSRDYLGGVSSYRMGYAYSVDLRNWKRDDTRLTLEPSESGWDSEMVAYPSVFSTGGDWYVAYVGNGVGFSGIGIAKLAVLVDDLE